MKQILFSFVFFGFALTVNGQKFVNEFLNIGVGAQAHGMSGSVAASIDDITAAYWNPAGLAFIEDDYQGGAMHASWFGGIANYDYLGFGANFGSSRKPAFGSVSLIRMGVDNIPNTINLIGPDGTVNYDNITSFSAADYALLCSYAREFGYDFYLGLTAKIVHRTIGEFGSAWGFGFDAGAIYALDNFRLGVMVRDITTTVNAWSFNLTAEEQAVFNQTGNEIPTSSVEIALPKLTLAAAAFGEFGNDFSYLAELDIRLSTDGTEAGLLSGGLALDPSLGIEVGYDELVYIRAGLGNIQRTINIENTAERKLSLQPNVGVGLDIGRVRIDYALANIGSVSDALVSHIFSGILEF